MKKVNVFLILMIGLAMFACEKNEPKVDDKQEEVAPLVFGEVTTIDNNGYAAVDLGLESGTLWATKNVGATSPEAAGNYYAWGEIITKASYNWQTYSFCYIDTMINFTKYASQGVSPDNLLILDSIDDVVAVTMQGTWRMPTQKQMNELKNSCLWEWGELNGVKGYKVSSKVEDNKNYIFMPAAGSYENDKLFSEGERGAYWTSELNKKPCTNAYYMQLDTATQKVANYYRYGGRTVRGVCIK